jgi:hypothetical protein
MSDLSQEQDLKGNRVPNKRLDQPAASRLPVRHGVTPKE